MPNTHKRGQSRGQQTNDTKAEASSVTKAAGVGPAAMQVPRDNIPVSDYLRRIIQHKIIALKM